MADSASTIPAILIRNQYPGFSPLLNPDGRDENGWQGWVRAILDILHKS